MMIAKAASGSMLGIDCVTQLSAADCSALAGLGIRFAGRYLGHIPAAELDAILDSSLQLLCIGGDARTSDWSAQTGASDAATTLAAAKALGLPGGVTIFLDLEGDGMTADGVNAYALAWARAIQAGGYLSGLYAGSGCPLDGAALYELPVTAYWAPCTPYYSPSCGFQVVQAHPGDQTFAGLEVDFDLIQADYKGRWPVLVAAL